MTANIAEHDVGKTRARAPADPLVLYRHGVDQVNEGRYAEAHRTLARAAQAAEARGELDIAARVAGTSGYLLAISSDADAGERLCREALARPGLSPETVAILYGQLGSIEMSRGRLESASEWLSKSIRGLAHDPLRAANMRMNRALVDMDRGQFDAAKVDLEWAERAYLEQGDVLAASQAEHNHGYVSMLEGDLVRALRTMERVRAPLDSESELWAATNELDRAQALSDAGLITEAEASLANVARVFAKLSAVREQADAEYLLARSLLRHAPLRAARVAAAAARRFRRVGSDARALRAEALQLRALLVAGSDVEPGAVRRRMPTADRIASTVEALEGQGSRGDAAALRLTERLARLRRTGRDREATARLPKAVPLEVTLMTYELRAEHARLAGHEADARREAARGVEVLERSQKAMGSLELQGASPMLGRGLLRAGLSSAVRSARPDVIFDWSERARHMSLQVVPLRPPPDPDSAAELAELRMIRAAHPDGDWLVDPRAAALRDRARERQWSHTGTASIHERVRLDEARSALDDGDAIISFVYDGHSLVALAATRRRTEAVHLDVTAVRSTMAGLRSDLDMSASVRSGAFALAVQASLDDRLAALSRLLLAPTAAVIGDAWRVAITMPGMLSGAPWTMLPALRGRAVTVTPSVSRWVRQRAGEAWRAESVGFAAGPHVARGEEEVGRSAAAWPDERVLRANSSTVDAVTDLASRVDILHIAAHGRHSSDNPQFSAVELADGPLFGYDIDRIARVPQTVVLSACELGRSSVRWGEEAIGMTRAWLHAGTRCVIASPVVVTDDVACELLGAMHVRLAAGALPAEALAHAAEKTGIVAPFHVHGTGF